LKPESWLTILFRLEEEFLNFERLPVPPNEALPNDVIKQTVAVAIAFIGQQ
jgi:hypothetical protein